MVHCKHTNIKCLNEYDHFRKYLCQQCNQVFICECDKEMLSRLFPHQLRIGEEYETTGYVINGFAEKICFKCKGFKEEPHPKAKIYGLRKKVDRFYWREIEYRYYQHILGYIKENKLQIKDIFDFNKRYPEESKKFREESRIFWKNEHKRKPKYDTKEMNEEEFLKKVKVPVETISAKYELVNNVGRWITSKGERVSPERYVMEYYKEKGYDVFRCERRLISTLVGAYLITPIWEDKKAKLVYFGPRGKLRTTKTEGINKHGLIALHQALDFGTEQFYKRNKDNFNEWLDHNSKFGLISLYDYFLANSWELRDYLWVYNQESEELTRKFLKTVPDKTTIHLIKWTIQDFWNRETGWPDLFVVKDKEYWFIEVKSPYDRLSNDQMRWFEWVISNNIVTCKICKLKRSK